MERSRGEESELAAHGNNYLSNLNDLYRPWIMKCGHPYLIVDTEEIDFRTETGLEQVVEGIIDAVLALDLPPKAVAVAGTVADGLALRTPVEYTLAVLENTLDGMLLVSEADVYEAIRTYANTIHQIADGAAAVALAAARAMAGELAGQRVGMVLTGGNIEAATLKHILGGGDADVATAGQGGGAVGLHHRPVHALGRLGAVSRRRGPGRGDERHPIES